MEIEFDCGTIVPNVGELVLAMRSHLMFCTDQACIADVKRTILKHIK